MFQRSKDAWTIELGGTPVPKPRMSQRDKFLPSKPAARYFAWAEEVKMLVRMQCRAPFHSPIALSVRFFLPIPKSVSKREAELRLLKPHGVKPDLKNLVAGVEDALNGVLWVDDALIYEYRQCSKHWIKAKQGFVQLTVHPFFAEPEQEGGSYPQHIHKKGIFPGSLKV